LKTYLLLFLIAFYASLTLTPMVRRVCERHGWFDEPGDARRVHRTATPRLGGVAVFAALAIALTTLLLINNLLTQVMRAELKQLMVALVPAVLVFLLGVYDDLRGVNAHLKLLAQVLAATLFYLLGGRVEGLSAPFVGSILLPQALSFALTVFWVVAITNAFNLIDGIDGLAAGAALFASLVMVVVSIILGHPFVTVTAIALAGALIGFLRYNFNPASIFLGDSGSLFIGFLLATLSVQGTQKASTAVAVAIPLLAFGVPVIDTSLTLVRRFIGKRPLFQSDREHIHHMLLARGWSQRRVTLALYGVCALLGLQALLFVSDTGRGALTGLLLFVVGVSVIVAVNQLKYHEVEEIRAGLKRNLSFTARRLRLANNIRVRRASHALSQATSLDELFCAVQEMLELSGFVCATVQLSRSAGVRKYTEKGMARGAAPGSSLGSEYRQGGWPPSKEEVPEDAISWLWAKGSVNVGEVIESGRFWSLRLSLVTGSAQWGYINLYWGMGNDTLLLDANYLCGLFQRQMGLAVERVLGESDLKLGPGSGQTPATSSAAALQRRTPLVGVSRNRPA